MDTTRETQEHREKNSGGPLEHSEKIISKVHLLLRIDICSFQAYSVMFLLEYSHILWYLGLLGIIS